MGKNIVKNLYDIGSFVNAAEAAKTFDGAAGLLLPRQLEHISTTIHKQHFAELSLLTQSGITVNNEGGTAEFITKLKQSIIGDFATAGDSTNTNGKISLKMQSDTIPVIMKKAESDWTQVQLEQAQSANTNLVSDLIGAHNTKYNQLIDKTGYVGTGSMKGLLNWSGFTTGAAGGVFSGLTGIQQYTEIKNLINAQRAGVSDDPVFGADKVAISTTTNNLISSTYVDTTGGIGTVKEAIERNFNVKFAVTFRAASVGGTDRLVAYSSDARAMVMRIPMQLRVSNIYQKGFSSYVESMFRVAGLDVIENASGRILTGV